MKRLYGFILLALATSNGLPALAQAKEETFHGDYAVSYLGLTLARSSFITTFKGDNFSVSGSLSSAGLAELFDSTRGTIVASGSVGKAAPLPMAYATDYVSGRKKQRTEIRFSRGNVSDTVNNPPLKKRGKDWVPLKDADLKSVADPISATLIRARNLSEVCGRTVKIYDGEMRADLALGAGSITPFSVQGYKGDAVTCSARFVPVSGYRKGRRALEFLRDKSKITIAFAPLGTTGIYAPIYATVGTEIGTITVKARRFEAK